MLIVGSAEANDRLLSLMANIYSHKHCLPTDLLAKAHPPEVSTELSIDLPDDVDKNTVIILQNSLLRHKLTDDWTVSINFIFESRVKILLLDLIWHDNQKEHDLFGVRVLLALLLEVLLVLDVVLVVASNAFLEALDAGVVVDQNEVSVVDVDVQALVLGQLVESLIEVVGVVTVFVLAEDGPLLEVDGLVHAVVQHFRVLQLQRRLVVRREVLVGLVHVRHGVVWLELALWDFVHLGAFEHFGLDGVWLELDGQVPLLDLGGAGNHAVELLDALDAFVRLLEKGLSDVSHGLFVFSNIGGNTNKDTEFWWKINILSFLLDFEQGLFLVVNLGVIGV
jgi:hypothetical protein